MVQSGFFKRSLRFDTIYVIHHLTVEDKHKTGKDLMEEAIHPAVQASGIGANFIDLKGSSELIPALTEVLRDCIEKARMPIVHFETHGHPLGLGPSVDDLVTWADLRES